MMISVRKSVAIIAAVSSMACVLIWLAFNTGEIYPTD